MNQPRSGVGTPEKSSGRQRMFAFLMSPIALGLVLVAGVPAKAMTISQETSNEVMGVDVTGCVDIKGASIASGAHVDFFPCNGNANEQWSYVNGELIGLGGNCLTTVSGLAVMEACSGATSQIWHIDTAAPSRPGATIKQGIECLTEVNLGDSANQLKLAGCGTGSWWIVQ